jgi:hypothetical protein
MHQLTLAVSHVLDAMADVDVKDPYREKLHEPLVVPQRIQSQLGPVGLPLLCVPDDEITWQSTMRRTGKAIQGVSRLVSATKGLDLHKFIEGLAGIQEVFDDHSMSWKLR